MLQIFVRPREDELLPNFQHREFPQTESLNLWRFLAGPEQSNAPFTLRDAVWIHDAHLEHVSLRTPSITGLDGHLYVFRGEISANGHKQVLLRNRIFDPHGKIQRVFENRGGFTNSQRDPFSQAGIPSLI